MKRFVREESVLFLIPKSRTNKLYAAVREHVDITYVAIKLIFKTCFYKILRNVKVTRWKGEAAFLHLCVKSVSICFKNH